MALNSLLRRTLLALAVLASCSGALAAAQPAARAHGQAHPHAIAAKPQAPGQPVFDATNLGSPALLNKGWRVGITSDPAAALPGFDDSQWAIRDAAQSFEDVPDEGDDEKSGDTSFDRQREFVWFRLHVRLAPNHGPLALLMEIPVSHTSTLNMSSSTSDAVVFVDGHEVHAQGPHGNDPGRYLQITRLYNLPVAPGATGFTLAIRTLHIPFGLSAYTRFFSMHTLRLGDQADLGNALEVWNNHALFELLPKLINAMALAILGIFLLALYFTQKGHREYLWLALYELVQAPISFIDLAGRSAYLERMLYAALWLQLVVASAYLYFEFLIAFLDLGHRWANKRKRWLINLLRWSAPILLGTGPTLYFVDRGGFMPVLMTVVYLLSGFWFLGWLLFCFTVLMVATVRRNFEAGLLLVPLVLSFIGILEPVFTSGMVDWTGHTYHSPLTIMAGPIPIHFASVADFVGLLAIVLIIFFRFQRIHRDRERASSELAAARSVQGLMIPQEKLKTPGFEIDSVYNPANEVGGDFFHIETTAEGGLLVVIGDVAGKGLQAAMNVSMLVGALRRGDELRPAKILEALNRVLVGSGSFTTCEAALFLPDGELVVASAGHLPPYLNSQEVALSGGLPLGVIPNASYDEARLYLHPGDRVLFLSDGVVEARHPSGELFGFDRVHNLSNQSAFYIADAAKTFGQEDDITVLTVRRLAQVVAA